VTPRCPRCGYIPACCVCSAPLTAEQRAIFVRWLVLALAVVAVFAWAIWLGDPAYLSEVK
jgi:hypothetical protein